MRYLSELRWYSLVIIQVCIGEFSVQASPRDSPVGTTSNGSTRLNGHKTRINALVRFQVPISSSHLKFPFQGPIVLVPFSQPGGLFTSLTNLTWGCVTRDVSPYLFRLLGCLTRQICIQVCPKYFPSCSKYTSLYSFIP